MKTLKPFQQEGIAFLKSKYHAILADDMGLGKTLQAIRSMDAIGATKVLIVCPTTLKITWFNSILYDSAEVRYLQILRTGNDIVDPMAEVVIISYDLLATCHYKFRQYTFDLLICDEAHYMRSTEAKRTWAVLGDKGKGVASQCKYKWMLTGTLIENKPNDLFPIFVTLFYKYIVPYDSYDKFVRRYCGGYYRGGQIIPRLATHKEELAERIKPFVLRRKLADVINDMPALTTETIYLEPTSTALKLIDEEKRDISVVSEYKSEFGAQSKHRQALALAKLDQATEYIKEVLVSKEKVVVFAYHRAVVDQLMERLIEFCPVRLVGGMNDKQKHESIQLFVHKKEVRVFIGNVEAAGTGVDGLQKVCNTEIFVEFDLRPGKVFQAISRLWRMMQKHPVLAQFLVIDGSWESRKLRQILQKAEDNEKILGGD